VVKFRCPVCTQKILVNDEGVGLVIPCPNCARDIAIPHLTAPEFQGQVLALASSATEWRPHLARLLMDRLFQAVLHQRRHLLAAQEAGTAQLATLEQRLIRLHQEHEIQKRGYEDRIVDLENQLAQREEESRQLIREKFQLAKEALDRQAEDPTEQVDYVLRA